MPTPCKFCGEPIDYQRNERGVSIAVDPDYVWHKDCSIGDQIITDDGEVYNIEEGKVLNIRGRYLHKTWCKKNGKEVYGKI